MKVGIIPSNFYADFDDCRSDRDLLQLQLQMRQGTLTNEENFEDFSVLGYSQANGFFGDFLELSLRVSFGV